MVHQVTNAMQRITNHVADALWQELCDVASVALNNAMTVNPESLGTPEAKDKDKKDEK